MKWTRSLLVSLLLVAGLWSAAPVPVYAAAADEKSLERVEKELDALWAYVDESQSLSDDAFYPEFATRARDAQKEIAKTESELAATKETRDTKEAVDRLREDVQQIQVALIAWKAAAEAKDTVAFEDASYLLQSVVEIYNEDIDAYNTAAHGSRAMAQLAIHAVPLFVAFALSAILLAVARYQNEPAEDVVGEVRRQLRWHLWFTSLFCVVIALVPLYVYLFTDLLLPVWAWSALLLGLLPMVFVLLRYAKIRRLAGRP